MCDFTLGFFDSGIGGLCVLSKAVELLGNQKYIYLGDNNNAPYGNKSKKEIYDLSVKNISKLLDFGAGTIVVACNTVTTTCIDDLRKKFPTTQIIGVEPNVKQAIKECENPLVIGTKASLCSQKFLTLINGKNISVFPLKNLAEDIEKNIFNTEKINLEEHLGSVEKIYDGVVLGCTHYSFIKNKIQKFMNCGKIFDGADGTARRIFNILSEKQILNKKNPLTFKECVANSNMHILPLFIGENAKWNQKVFAEFFLRESFSQ